MSTVTRHPTIKRVPTHIRNTAIYEVVQAEAGDHQTPQDPIQEGPSQQDAMEGVEAGSHPSGEPHVGDKTDTLLQ